MPKSKQNATSSGASEGSKENVAGRINKMFDEKVLCDVTFLVGEDAVEFTAHRLVLATLSDTLHDMLYRSTKVESEPENLSFIVNNIDPEGFSLLLRFAYKDEAIFTSSKQAIACLSASVVYGIRKLSSYCLSYLNFNINSDNICEIYSAAVTLEEEKLINNSEIYILRNWQAFVQSDGFLNLTEVIVLKLIGNISNTMNPDLLFTGFLKWVQGQTNCHEMAESLRNRTLKFLPYMKFLEMSREFFFRNVVPTGILTDSEVTSLALGFYKIDGKPLPPWCNKDCGPLVQPATSSVQGNGIKRKGSLFLRPKNKK